MNPGRWSLFGGESAYAKRVPSWKMRGVTRVALLQSWLGGAMVRRAHCKSKGWRFESRGRRDCFFYFIFFLSVFFVLFCFVLFVCLFFN